MFSSNLIKLEKVLRLSFKDKNWLTQALTHRSYLNEHPHFGSSNERLEFLGDAILEFWVSRELFSHFPQLPEGELTDLRAKIVRTESLADLARQLDLGQFLYLSRGEESGGGRENESLLADCVEAVIGAIFSDQGFTGVEEFLTDFIRPKIQEVHSEELKDPKSIFQEIAQEKFRITPIYKVLKSQGPDHAKIFLVGAYLKEKQAGQGGGKSKQEAEQAAAKAALANLKK
jgi:ribonuclease-3